MNPKENFSPKHYTQYHQKQPKKDLFRPNLKSQRFTR